MRRIYDPGRIAHFRENYDFLYFLCYVGHLVWGGNLVFSSGAVFAPHVTMEGLMPLWGWGLTAWAMFAAVWAANHEWLSWWRLPQAATMLGIFWLTVAGCFIAAGSLTGWVLYAGFGLWCLRQTARAYRIEGVPRRTGADG